MINEFIWFYLGGWSLVPTAFFVIGYFGMKTRMANEGIPINWGFLKATGALSALLWLLTAGLQLYVNFKYQTPGLV